MDVVLSIVNLKMFPNIMSLESSTKDFKLQDKLSQLFAKKRIIKNWNLEE